MGLPGETAEVIGAIVGYVDDFRTCELPDGYCASVAVETPDGKLRGDATVPVSLRRDLKRLVGFSRDADGSRMPVRLVLETAPDAFLPTSDRESTVGAMDASLKVLEMADGLVVSDRTSETGEPTWVVGPDVPSVGGDVRAVTHDGISWDYRVAFRDGSGWSPVDPSVVERLHRFAERFNRFSGSEFDVLMLLSKAARYRVSHEGDGTVTVQSGEVGDRRVTAIGRPPYGRDDWEYATERANDVPADAVADVLSFVRLLTEENMPWVKAPLPESKTR